MCRLVAESDEGQELVDPLAVPRGCVPRDEERKSHILGHAQQWDEIEELEHEAGLVAPGQRPVLLVQRRDADAVDDDLAGCRQVQATEQLEHGRLARAGGAHDGDELALLDRERHASQRIDLALAQRIALDEVLRLEDDRHVGESTDASPLRGGRCATQYVRRVPCGAATGNLVI